MESNTVVLPVPLLPMAWYHYAPVIVSQLGLAVVGGGVLCGLNLKPKPWLRLEVSDKLGLRKQAIFSKQEYWHQDETQKNKIKNRKPNNYWE